jgi:four helix bundle protein
MGLDIRWKQKSRRRPHHSNEAWRLGKALCMEIYRVTAGFPGDERYELRSQLRRAAVSVPSNIAEGSARRTTRSYLKFLYMARGSLNEIDTQMEIAEDLGYLANVELTDTLKTFDHLSHSLQNLINALERKLAK